MKRIQYLLCMAAAATIGLAGCSKDEPVMTEPSADNFMFNIVPDDFNAAAATSRTAYDPAIGNIVWTAGDQMQLYVDMAARQSTAELTDGKASFKAYFSLTAPATINLQGAVPASAVLGVKAKDEATKKVTSLQMALPNVQNATLTTFDPAADILIAQDMSVEVTADDITAGYKVVSDFRFGRPMAITQYTFTLDNPALTADETVESVTLTVNPGQGNAEKGLTGRFYFNPGTGYFVDNTGATVDATVNPFYQGQSLNNVKVAFAEQPKLGELVMWAVTAPVKLEAGDQMVFTVKTSKNTIVKTVTLASELAFVNTQLNTAGVKLNAKNCEVTPNEVPGGQSSIKLEYGEVPTVTSYTTSPITTTSGWEINSYFTSTVSGITGWIQTRSSSNSYILSPAVEGTVTSVKVLAIGSSASASIALLDPDTKVSISTKTVPTTNTGTEITFDNLEAKNLTHAYISTTNATVYFGYVEVLYNASPKIVIAPDFALELAANDTETHSFTYSLLNAADADVTVSVPTDVTWFTANKGSTANTVDYLAEENTGNVRTTTITLTLKGGNSVEIPVKQAGTTSTQLPAVTDMTASAKGTTIDVTWSAVNFASGYAWRIVKTSAPTVDIDSGTTDQSSVTIGSLETNTEYTIFVKALGNNTDFTDSTETEVTCTTEDSATTYTLTISYTDFNTTSYAANNGAHTKKASNDEEIGYYSNQIMQNSSVMQWQKTNSYLYNTTDLGSITSIQITAPTNNLTVYEGTTQQPSSGTVITPVNSGGVYTYTFSASKGYFYIKCGTLSKTTQLVITYAK